MFEVTLIFDGTIKNNLAQMTIDKGLFFNQDACLICSEIAAPIQISSMCIVPSIAC